MKKFNLLALLCSSLFAQNSFADNDSFFGKGEDRNNINHDFQGSKIKNEDNTSVDVKVQLDAFFSGEMPNKTVKISLDNMSVSEFKELLRKLDKVFDRYSDEKGKFSEIYSESNNLGDLDEAISSLCEIYKLFTDDAEELKQQLSHNTKSNKKNSDEECSVM